MQKNLASQKNEIKFANLLSHGVTGNTSVFGTEESRFEPQWDNKKNDKPPVNQLFAWGYFFIRKKKRKNFDI